MMPEGKNQIVQLSNTTGEGRAQEVSLLFSSAEFDDSVTWHLPSKKVAWLNKRSESVSPDNAGKPEDPLCAFTIKILKFFLIAFCYWIGLFLASPKTHSTTPNSISPGPCMLSPGSSPSYRQAGLDSEFPWLEEATFGVRLKTSQKNNPKSDCNLRWHFGCILFKNDHF